MRALVLAAGLGTRLKPWTLHHPKALVPVAGKPMLEHVLAKLENEGFEHIVVNIHHFGEQILEYLAARSHRAEVVVSDERNCLLDTGGGILHADDVLGGDTPMLIHNVDILSDAPLRLIMSSHDESGAEATLLTSLRKSSRRLCFNAQNRLCAWLDSTTGITKPAEAQYVPGTACEEAFSGIYVMSAGAIHKMRQWTTKPAFPIMDFFLANCTTSDFRRHCIPSLRLMDIGKPDALARAAQFSSSILVD